MIWPITTLRRHAQFFKQKGSASSDHEDTKWKEKTLDYRRSLDVTLKQCDRLQKEHEALMEEAQKADVICIISVLDSGC